MALQSWNDVLSYIKLELGSPLNMIEMSDDQLIDALKSQVLPFFSQFTPLRKYTFVNDSNLVYSAAQGQPRFRYRLPIPLDEHIIDIEDAYTTRDSIVADEFGIAAISHFDATNMAIANSYIDAIKSLQVRNTWEFAPPKDIIFDLSITSAVVVYSTTHSDLNTMPPDLYALIFKKLSLGKTMLWLAARRSKYENISTPFGQLSLNWQGLKDDGNKLVEEALQQLQNLPPDRLVMINV